MKTLRKLMTEYGGNGYVRIDAGNGSGGPGWIEWREDDEDAETKMVLRQPTALAYDRDGCTSTLLDEAAAVAPGCYALDHGPLYASAWIISDAEGATNPYRYRIIF